MKVICNYNDPTNLPDEFPDDFDYGLELGKEYMVMGIAVYKGSNCLYFLIDENTRPNWFPFLLFDISDNSLPQNWFVKVNGEKDNSDIYSLCGYEELCNDVEYYDKLVERDNEAMRTYFRRKIEYEKENLDSSY